MTLHQQRCANSGSVLQMMQMLNTCATTSQDDETALLLGMAAKALAQLQSHSDRMMLEAVDWKDKYQQKGQLFQELEDKNDDLVNENGELLVKCQELEVYGQMDGLSEKIEQSECELVTATALIEASPIQDEVATETRGRAFSGDVYKQLEQFELSIDLELEEFQQLVLLSVDENEKITGAKNRKNSASLSEASSRNPLHMLQRMLHTQDDAPMPAMTTSESLFSLSSDFSVSTRSTSGLRSFGPTKRSTKMSPEPNAGWAIIE